MAKGKVHNSMSQSNEFHYNNALQNKDPNLNQRMTGPPPALTEARHLLLLQQYRDFLSPYTKNQPTSYASRNSEETEALVTWKRFAIGQETSYSNATVVRDAEVV